ncbi:MAG: DegT/DnrJ/EryC1/StrS family aminotransferase [Fibrobacteria bacterium]|nr:DegT/DnrJ/EryC1/StrS family aminotransferase [Fibrobacteria bacterium]
MPDIIPIAKPYLTEEEALAAQKAILSGWVTQGPRVEEFENDFANYTGATYAVAVSSCTAALHLALLVNGVGPGDEVICPSLSFIATANAIGYTGAKPIFAEIDTNTLNLNPSQIEKHITIRTRAILVVHQIGLPAEIEVLSNICRKHNLALVEDAACAAGSKYNGKLIGSHSDLVCFSFHPRKVITTGDGGMITTSNPDYYTRLKRLRQHGMSIDDRERHGSNKIIKEEYLEKGFNYRMTDIQAAVGISQLKKLDWLVAERRKIAQQYREALSDISTIKLPHENEKCVSNYQSFSIYIKNNCPLTRDEIMQRLLSDGITTRPGIMSAHRERAYNTENATYSLPVTEDYSDRSFLIPLYVPMEKEEIERVILGLKNILS